MTMVTAACYRLQLQVMVTNFIPTFTINRPLIAAENLGTLLSTVP